MLDIIIPVYALTSHVEMMAQRSLKKLRESEPDARIIVIDNGYDRDRDDIFEHDVYVRLEDNRGYGGGVNLGYSLTETDPVIVSSIDVFVSPGQVSLLAKHASMWNALVSANAVKVRFGKNTHELEVPGCVFWGGLFAIPRHMMDHLGGIDTDNFPLRFGDTDFGVRAAKAGFIVGRAPDVIVEHHDPSISTLFMEPGQMDAEYQRLFEVHGEFDPYTWQAVDWRTE